LSMFAHSIGLRVCNSSASELTSICSPSPFLSPRFCRRADSESLS
jgi:hypothetical protein